MEITNKMNAVIHYFLNADNFINGSFFYILDYYLYLVNECKKDIYFIGMSDDDYRPFIFDIISKRYDVPIIQNKYLWISLAGLERTADICLNLTKLLYKLVSYRITKCLLNIETLQLLNGIMPARLVAIQGTHNTEIIKDKIDLSYNHYILFEESDNYVKKLYLQRIKYNGYCSNNNTGFINLKGLRYISEDQFEEYIQPHLSQLNKLYVFGDKNLRSNYDYLLKYDKIEMIYDNPSDLFSLFDTYIDMTLNTFDYSPRMLIEAVWFGKKIIYIDNGREDGAKRRYNDIMNNNIDKYILAQNDDIVNLFIKE